MKICTAIGLGLTISLMMANANATENSNLIYQHENWAGAYFGLHFGSGGGSVDTSLNTNSFFIDTTNDPGSTSIATGNSVGKGSLSGNASGSLADLFIGYNFHLNNLSNFIFGGQLEGTFFSDITLYSKGMQFSANSQTQTSFPGGVPVTTSGFTNDIFQYSDELRSMFTFLARAGYLVQPNILIYILGGGAEGNFVLPQGEFFGVQRNMWKLGYTAGVGLEYRFNNNWSLQGEYRFLHFGFSRHEAEPENFVSINGVETRVDQSTFNRTFDTDFDFNMGKIGIVYRFDSPISFK